MDEVTRNAMTFIKSQEGLKLKAYQDGRGKWTIGYGSTGMFITSQTVWTEDQALNDLYHRVDAIYRVLRAHVVPSLESGQWTAIISLAYNIGVTGVLCSNLIRKINERDFSGAADEFPSFDHITIAGVKHEDKGLLARRLREQELFKSGIEKPI